ncbi:hypothetical protein M8J76_009876 [Diaphorina citri]|nr:hypothetical protein M8J76_009876 [Diaphorina citri]
MALLDIHFMANILNPKYRGERLTEEQFALGMKYAQEYFPNAMADKFRAQTSPFHDYLFTPESTDVKPVVWWMAQKRRRGAISPTFTPSVTEELQVPVPEEETTHQLDMIMINEHQNLETNLHLTPPLAEPQIFNSLSTPPEWDQWEIFP